MTATGVEHDMIEAVLAALGERLMRLEGARSVIVAGSAGRGEAAVLKTTGRTVFLGDIELLLVVHRRLGAEAVTGAVAEAIASMAGFDVAPHVEVAQIPERRLGGLQRKLFVFETREAGRCIGGEDLRPAMPKVTLASLDRDELDEVYLHRQEALLKACGDDGAPVPVSYAIARNTLDLVTMMLPQVGVLLPTYRARADYITEHPDLAFMSTMPAGFETRVVRYTDWKVNPALIPTENSPTLRSCLQDFDAAAHWLRSRGGLRLSRYARRRRILRAMLVATRAVVRREASVARAIAWVTRPTLRERSGLVRMLLEWRAEEAGGVVPRDSGNAYRLLDRISLQRVECPEDWDAWRRAYLQTWDVHRTAS